MTYLNAWHRDYAAESLSRMTTDMVWVQYAVECGEVAKLAATLGGKTADIAETVISTIQDSVRMGTRSRRTITPKQRYALATALLEKFGTARAIANAVWGLTDEEIENA